MKRWIELLLFGSTPLIALAVAPMLARGLGPDGRGQYALALAVFALGTHLGNLGQAERFAADLRHKSVVRKWHRYVLIGSASVIATIAAYIAMRLLGMDLYTALVVAITVPISSFGLTWSAAAIARGCVLLLAVQAAASAVLRLVLVALMFTSHNLTTLTATAVTMLTTALGILLVWSVLVRTTTSADSTDPGAAERSLFLSDVKTGLAQGLPVVGFTLCTAVMLRADVFMLSALSTPNQVGFYAATVAITESALALSAAFKNRMQATPYTGQPLNNVRRELLVMSALILPAAVLSQLIVRPFTITILGEAFAPAVPAFRILIFAAVAQVFLDSGQGLLAVLGQRRVMFGTSAFGAGLTVLILWLTVPRFGAVGAAVASLCAYSIVGAVSWNWSIRMLRREQPP